MSSGGDVELVLIVAEGCPACKEAVKSLPKDAKVKVLDVTKDLEAARIVRALEIYKVPLLVAVERREDGKAKYCVLDGEKVKCVEDEGGDEGAG
ncbi:MAG: hypothetical protein QXQ60_07520 [Thermofilum sp.]